ncbi:MAG: hypothetical protein AAFX87_03455 [Bacteroidota bacterium]
MRKIVISILALLAVHSLHAQCDNPYYSFDQGSKWTMENYSAKGKKTGKVTSEITKLDKSGGGFNATIKSTTYDKKDEMILEGELDMQCESGVIRFDMRKFIPEETLKTLGGAEMEVVGDNLELPANLSVGEKLKDGSIRVNGDLPFNISVDITNRKVAAKESVTTPAGTFECYKITYDVKLKTVIGIQAKGAEWIARKVGIVKTESYNKNGKLTGYSVLSAHD